MPTNKQRITANLDTEDYQWIDEMAELTGNSRAGVIRQIVRGLRLGKPELLPFGDPELVFAGEPSDTGNETTAAEDEMATDEREESGLREFSTE